MHNTANKRLRVAINAQLPANSGDGGIETVLMALAVMAQLNEAEEEYVFIGHAQDVEWLRPWLGPDQQIISGPQPAKTEFGIANYLESLKRSLGPLRPMARDLKRRLVPGQNNYQSIGGNFFDQLACDVVHFPFQSYQPCRVPTVFNPHDLQHLHFPDFFDEAELARRHDLYAFACRSAHTVVVASDYVKQDLVRHYLISPDRIQVIPWAPPEVPTTFVLTDKLIRDVREKYQVANKFFVLYPAMTWEHKNHIRLLKALALLRDRNGIKVRLICTGKKKSFWPKIAECLNELELVEQATFPGMVQFQELCVLYHLAQSVFIPTLFEATSAPLFEAWQHRDPVACANVTSLPEQAADAALLFDPFSVASIAAALLRLSTESALRATLRERGTRRLEDFSIERTARAYRAVYRRAAGRSLSAADHELLSNNPAYVKQRPEETLYA